MPIRLNEEQVYKTYNNVIKIDDRLSRLFVEPADFFTRDEHENLNQIIDKSYYNRYPNKTCQAGFLKDCPNG